MCRDCRMKRSCPDTNLQLPGYKFTAARIQTYSRPDINLQLPRYKFAAAWMQTCRCTVIEMKRAHQKDEEDTK